MRTDRDPVAVDVRGSAETGYYLPRTDLPKCYARKRVLLLIIDDDSRTAAPLDRVPPPSLVPMGAAVAV